MKCFINPKVFFRVIKALFALPKPKKKQLFDIVVSSIGLYGTPFTFVEDGLCTIHNSDFCNDSLFKKAYEKGRGTSSWRGWDLRWRAYLFCCFAESAKRIQGDYVECGVNLGGNARMLIEFLSFEKLQKNFLLFDTFSGFDSKLVSKEERSVTDGLYCYPSCLSEVQRTFAGFPFVKIIPGSVPDSLKTYPFSRICFLSIDMNCVAPEIAAFEYLWPFVSPGGVIFLDDYGFKAHFRQKEAFDLLSAKMNFRIIQLPTGQGLVIKPFA